MPLLRRADVLKPLPALSFSGTHRPPGLTDGQRAAYFGLRGTIADAATVPSEPTALVRWLSRRLDQHRAASKALAKRNGVRVLSVISTSTRLNYGLVDLTIAPELSGPQRAAAYDALSTRAGVRRASVPTAFRGPNRVAVGVSSAPGNHAEYEAMPVPERVIVFDRTTHRAIGETQPGALGAPDRAAEFGGGRGRLRRAGTRVTGTRYGPPIAVKGPGLDDHCRERLDLDRTLEPDLSP